MRNLLLTAYFAGVIAAAPIAVTVPGASNPFLAGQPDGTTCCSGDSAPAQSPVLVGGLSLTAGQILTFSVSNWVNHTGGGDQGFGQDGGVFFSSGPWGTGIGGFNAPIDALMGVFLDDAQPAPPEPAFLDYSVIGTDFLTFSPLVRQVFFIGDGLTNGMRQEFVVPTGATRLYLATSDGFGWFNNSGAFNVIVDDGNPSAVPEPSTWLLAAVGLLLVAGKRLV